MRGNIVIPDTLNTIVEFAPIHAEMCEEISEQRYQKAKAKGGLTVAAAITGMHYQVEWTVAALSGKKASAMPRRALPQRGLAKRFAKGCSALEKLDRKFSTKKALEQWIALPDKEYDGSIAMRAISLIEATHCCYQIYQYHLRRAFYTFDKESGFMFPGGHRAWLKMHEESVISALMPVIPPAD